MRVLGEAVQQLGDTRGGPAEDGPDQLPAHARVRVVGQPGEEVHRAPAAQAEPVQGGPQLCRVARLARRLDPGEQDGHGRRRAVQRVRVTFAHPPVAVPAAQAAARTDAGAGAVGAREVAPAGDLRYGADPVHLAGAQRARYDHLPAARVGERADPRDRLGGREPLLGLLRAVPVVPDQHLLLVLQPDVHGDQ
ncbi:hypothetical protein ACGF12_11990 [Kitasatospora sp. NPDC048296]|uniref:hypothetical protein n=1 Tax=Kitasatospora sp. NPDC048296 TaxID=3364048 RepID=UPI0037189C3A